MASKKKKIKIPISNISSEEINTLQDNIDSNYEEKIDNLMNDFNTEFVDRTAIQNSESDISEVVICEKDDSNFIPTTKPIEAVVKSA